MICGLSVATRAGIHLRCTLPHGHEAGCDPYASPAAMTSEDLLRGAAAVLRTAFNNQHGGSLLLNLAIELNARAVVFSAFRRMAENDRRRGFVLPLAWVNRLDGVSDPVSVGLEWALPNGPSVPS